MVTHKSRDSYPLSGAEPKGGYRDIGYGDEIRVSMDMEDTLAEVNRTFLENKPDVSFEELVNYDFSGVSITIDEFLEESVDLWKNSWDEIPPTEENISEVVGEIYNMDHVDVDIVTAREGCEEEMRKWLELQEVPFSNFVVSEDKHELDYDVYIDDHPGMVGKADFLFLYPRPWNKEFKYGETFKRIDERGLMEVLEDLDYN